MKPRVTLRSSRDSDGVRSLEAYFDDAGDFVFDGQDLGDGVERIFGSREYEWIWTIRRANVAGASPIRAARTFSRSSSRTRSRSSAGAESVIESPAMRAFILEGEAAKETTDFGAVRDALAAKKTIWIDLEAQTPEADELLAGPLGLHPLTIEDIWSDSPSPKADEFPSYLYVCAHTVKRDKGDLLTCEVDLVIGANFVVTHDTTRRVSDALRDEITRSPRLLARGAPWMAHAVLDRLVDGYLPVIDAFDDDVEALEDDVLAKAGTPEGAAVLGRILALKRSLQSLRRVSIHQRELLLRLARGEFACFPADVLPYLRDVHDHFVRVGDLADSYRDLVTSALDAYLSVQSNRMNEVMKTLTLISTVMLPLTFIAGVYGMNFDHMPELHWIHGYPYALGLMVVVAIAAFLWFRHKRWIT